MDETAVILVAHGSRVAGTVDGHLRVCDAVAAELGQPVRGAFLELCDPDIPTAIDDAVTGGAGRVVLVPYFLADGNHTLRDIPAIADAARARHSSVEIAVSPPLGPDARLVAISAERARATMGGAAAASHRVDGQPHSSR